MAETAAGVPLNLVSELQEQKPTVAGLPHLLQLKNRPQSLHHRVLLVMLNEVGQGVKLLPSSNVILHILGREGGREGDSEFHGRGAFELLWRFPPRMLRSI